MTDWIDELRQHISATLIESGDAVSIEVKIILEDGYITTFKEEKKKQEEQ